MRRRLRRREADLGSEVGMSLIEVLVASLMSVVIVSAACSMLISAIRDQPGLSRKSQNVTTARYQLERVVHELRNGIKLETVTASEVSLIARERRAACGGEFLTNPSAEPIQCKVTYSCSASTCTRSEATPEGSAVGTQTVALSGLGSTEVFCFVPSAEEDPTECGSPKEGTVPTYVGVNLSVPNPEGRGLLTISDGATLRSAAFGS
ncbi:MAG TPA: hypothetical protein VFI17_12405 [Solirubrobacterales bacterium]|nr:hypothetical protein [Solirubrobacterales bacterium]